MDPQSCAAIRELLPRYAADQLTPSERAAVERHIATCDDCHAELREWLTLGEWLARADATIPLDTGAARSLSVIHARLRQPPASRTAAYDLDGFDSLDGFERSALHTMPNQDSPHYPTGQDETLSSPALREERPPTASSGDAPSRPYQPQPPQRRIHPVVAGASVAVFLALVASLFYLLAPQLGPHRSVTTPTATATTQLTPTPKPLSGSWHTAPNTTVPAYHMQFAKSAPQAGYLCLGTDVGAGSVPASSAKWLYKTDDGGITWRPVGGITPPTLAAMNCEVFIDTNDANDVFVQLVCASWGPSPCEMLWRSRDGGASWSQLSMPQLPWGWANLVVVGSRIVGLGTDDNFSRNPYGPMCSTDANTTDLHQINDLFASDDGGKTWKQIGQPLIAQGLSIMPSGTNSFTLGGGGNPTPVVLSVGTTLFVRTSCYTGQSVRVNPPLNYWKSSDGGETWTKLPTPDSDMYFTPSATGGAYGVAVNPGLGSSLATPPVIWYSHDSGANWSALPSVGSIPLPPQIKKSAPGCVTTCYTHYSMPLAIALPDGSVLVELRVEDAKTKASLDALYAIDPQSPHPAWRQFAPMKVGSASIAWPADWPLAATKQGLVLWAWADHIPHPPTRVYLSPLP